MTHTPDQDLTDEELDRINAIEDDDTPLDGEDAD